MGESLTLKCSGCKEPLTEDDPGVETWTGTFHSRCWFGGPTHVKPPFAGVVQSYKLDAKPEGTTFTVTILIMGDDGIAALKEVQRIVDDCHGGIAFAAAQAPSLVTWTDEHARKLREKIDGDEEAD